MKFQNQQRTGLIYSFHFSIILLLTISLNVQSQVAPDVSNTSVVISGVIKDAQDQPLPGASIIVKETNEGVSSDASGFYRITAPSKNSILVFSHIGVQTQEVRIGNRNTIDIALAPEEGDLSEVVVIGYGAQKKVSLTSAVSDIKGEELTRRPVTSVQQALQGQLPGLTVLDQGGAPGKSNAVIRVRGITTLSNERSPLVIVDGIEQPLDLLNPNDIESISVLKDASSTAIYGSRAANGVILVTTKRGKAGKLTVSYNGFYAIQKAVSKPEHMDLESYMRLQNVARENMGSAPIYTDEYIREYVNATDREKYPLVFSWYETMYKTAPQTSHSISLSGGTDKIKTLLSVRFQDQQGIIVNTNSKLTDIRLNTDYSVSSKIKISGDLNYRYTKDLAPQNMTEIFRLMMQNSIWAVPKYSDGQYGAGVQANNPLLLAEIGGTNKLSRDYIVGNVKGEWEIVKGLTFTTRFGGRINFEYIKDFTSSYVLYDRDNPNLIRRQRPINQLTESRNQLREFTLNNLLNYSAVFGDHDIHALVGYSQIENQSNTLSAYRQQFYNNDVQSIGQGADNATKDNDGADANWGLRSYFGRANYVFRDKYLFEANARYDGSSRFIGDNQYGFFPSFSGGWRLSQENFWDNLSTTINEFKIRGSWGKTGNQAVPLYSYFSTLNMINYNFNGQLTPGYAQLSLANSELTWETTTQTNIGLDIAFLNNRISFGVDYYDKRTEGILLLLPVPGTLGLLPVSQNAGRVDNKGWEFQAGIRNDFGGFNLDANFNFNINNNKVVDLAGTGPYITGSDIDPRYIIGEGIPIDAFWGYKTDGYFQTDEEAAAYPQFMRPAKAGDVKVLDLNKDGIINGADMAHIGNTFPKYSFGSSINLSYRSFSLNLLFQGAAKTGVRLARALAEQGNYEGFTPSIITGNYWTPENRNARFPQPTKLDLRNQASTDRMVLDGSYLRLKNIQLGYRLPASVAQKISISGINVYLSATNLLTFSKLNDFKLDPESLSGWQNYYPQISLFTFGLNATF